MIDILNIIISLQNYQEITYNSRDHSNILYHIGLVYGHKDKERCLHMLGWVTKPKHSLKQP